ncbi:MAG TPA: L,D-transpeptidase [Actinomycetota bacterium]|nr:L,D-transpeptidase [Actinomycetota bacterium]
MRSSPRISASFQSSWLAMALAGLLTVATPVTAHLAGSRGAGPAPQARAMVAAAVDEAPRARANPDVEAPAAPREPRPRPHLLVDARTGVTAYRHPSRAAARLGTVATVSRFYHQRLVWWVEEVVRRGGQAWGRVELPYVAPRRDGWIPLRGLTRDSTWVTVRVDLSRHEAVVERRGEVVLRVPGATGAAISPTPPGEYVVTDHVAFGAGSSLGSFAFGISGIQPRLPPGWSGGDQLAIHGTNDPSSIGRSASAGCVRVSEWALDRFKPLLRQGTPVIIVP